MITLLRARPNVLLAKVWKPDGTIEPAACAKWFEGIELPSNNIEDIHNIIHAIEHSPRVALVKEAIASGADRNRMRRRCEAGVDKCTGEPYPAGLLVVPRPWIVLDIESLPRPAGMSFRDGDALASYVRMLLPDVFKPAACVWQFSGSSGHPSKRDDVRLHLFFMLSVDVIPSAWKPLFTRLAFVDQSAFDRVKLIFTAAPVIHAGSDPIQLRHGLLEGVPAVVVPEAVQARSAEIAQRGPKQTDSASSIAIEPMPEAAAVFVEIIARSNVLRSHHPSYRNDRARRLAFCAILSRSFGIKDEALLTDAFYRACIGPDDPNAEHDVRQAMEWATYPPQGNRTFSTRKLLCDASAALHEAKETELGARAARLAMVFCEIEARAEMA